MERGESGSSGVGVRALVEQELDDLCEPRVRGEHHRAHAPGIRVVDIGAGGNQEPRRREIADARGKHQRRVAAVRNQPVVLGLPVRRHRHHLGPHVRAGVDVGAAAEKDLDDIRVLL